MTGHDRNRSSLRCFLQVTMHGCGNFTSRILSGTELRDRNYLKEAAAGFPSPPPLSQTKDFLQRQVMGWEENTWPVLFLSFIKWYYIVDVFCFWVLLKDYLKVGPQLWAQRLSWPLQWLPEPQGPRCVWLLVKDVVLYLSEIQLLVSVHLTVHFFSHLEGNHLYRREGKHRVRGPGGGGQWCSDAPLLHHLLPGDGGIRCQSGVGAHLYINFNGSKCLNLLWCLAGV